MDILTLAVALGYTKKQVEEAKREGFKVQVEQDRSILETTGEEKVLYLLPKASSNLSSDDGYDEFVYANNKWEWVGKTDVDLDYELLSNKPQIRAWKRNVDHSSNHYLQGFLGFKHFDFEYVGTEGDIEIKLTDKVFKSHTNTLIGRDYDFNTFESGYAISGVFLVVNSRINNLPSAFTYFDTSNSARSYIFHYFDPTIQNGVTVPIIRQVIYLDTNGDTRNFIQLANATKNSDGSYSVSNANGWLELTGDSQIVSGVVNANGTITFTDSNGNTFTTTGSSVIGPQGDDYVLTPQDKSDIADIVLSELPTTQGVLYGNQSN